MADIAQAHTSEPQQMGPGGVPAGKCFSAGNPVFSNMLDVPLKPAQEQSPDELIQGYSSKAVHPVYRTSNSSYGSRAPSVHTMPTIFSAKSQKFTEHLGQCGMYKNHSLNCAMDKSNVPDH